MDKVWDKKDIIIAICTIERTKNLYINEFIINVIVFIFKDNEIR